MEISKTAFKEYARCLRVLPLERLYLQRLGAGSFFNDEDKEKMRDLLANMFSEEEGEDLLKEANEEHEAMLEYYSEVEQLALVCASRKFGREFTYYPETKNQKCFRFTDRYGVSFYCHLDGFSEGDPCVVVEVKATTSRKFQELGPVVSGKLVPLFKKQDNVLTLQPVAPELLGKADRHFRKLFDPYSDVGRYVFDIAIERYIVENGVRQSHPELAGKKFKYYLAVLNSDYVFSGEYEGGKPKYVTEGDGAVVTFIDLTEITGEFLPLIDRIRENISQTLQNPRLEEPRIGSYCEFGKRNGCMFAKVCFPELYEEGAITEYMNFRGIKTEAGKFSKFDLINNHKRRLLDVPEENLSSLNQKIQRRCYERNEEYINLHKIAAAIASLKHPFYYLDFESFPSPLPRFRGEKPYSQSLFQYSVHVEREPGDCDEIADNLAFLARDFSDCRESLVTSLIKDIDLQDGGTVLVYNKTFEENRLRELIRLFPEYQKELAIIKDSLFDMLYLLKANAGFYEKLGFSKEESQTVNYYHKSLRGLYSIKKVLPLFSDLSYSELNVKKGTEAIAAYARFKHLPPEDIEVLREDLLRYCRRDTWSMVVVLNNLRKRI